MPVKLPTNPLIADVPGFSPAQLPFLRAAAGGGGGGGGSACLYPFDAPPAEVTDSGTTPMTLSNDDQTMSGVLTGTPNHEFEAYPANLWTLRASTGGEYFTPREDVLCMQLHFDALPKHSGGGSGYSVAYRVNLAYINFALNDRIYVCAEVTDDGRTYPSLRNAAGAYVWEALGWVDDILDMGLYHDPVNDRWGIITRTVTSGVPTTTDHGYIAALDGYGMRGAMYGFCELQETSAAADTSGETVTFSIYASSVTWDLPFPSDGEPVCVATAANLEAYYFDGNPATLGYGALTVDNVGLSVVTDTSSTTYLAVKQALIDRFTAIGGGGSGNLGDIEIPGSGLLFLGSFKVPATNFPDPAGSTGSRYIGIQTQGGVYTSGVADNSFSVTCGFSQDAADADGYFFVTLAGDYSYNSLSYGFNISNVADIFEAWVTVWIDCDTRQIYYKIGSITSGVVNRAASTPYVIPAGITHVSMLGIGYNVGITSSEPMDGAQLDLTYVTQGENLFGGGGQWVTEAANIGKSGQDIYGNVAA